MTIRDLRKYRYILSKQQIKTLRGLILAGDAEAVQKGLKKILKRQGTI